MKRGPFRQTIVMRWSAGVLSVVGVAVIAIVIAVSLLVKGYVQSGVQNAVGEYVAPFEQLSGATETDFREAAISLCETFPYNDKVKVVVMDGTGRVIASTDGFVGTETLQATPDFEQLLQDTDKQSATWSGTNASNGEHILATSVRLQNAAGIELGTYRYAVSMERVDRTVRLYDIIIIAVGLIMIALVGVSGIYFISSIVRPVRQVTGAARKIAMGDLSTRLETKDKGEIGELCDTINYMASELGKAETVKNDFISSVSHELRTPLTAIRGWGETVSGSIGTDEELVRRGVDVMLTETDRLSKLVEELLDFSRLQSGNFKVNMEALDLVPILNQAVNMYEELARKQGLHFVYMKPKTAVYVMADKDRIKQVFINIIDNAVKYTESGGQVLISAVMQEGCLHVVVSDTGVGIPEADLSHVKEKFYKANKTVRGSGIGLAVADEIVCQHNGFIFVESKESVGTTVTVVLPLCEWDDEPEEPKEEQNGE